LKVHSGLESFLREIAGSRFWLLTTKGTHCYSDIRYSEDDVLIFGRETAGLPESLLTRFPDRCVRIPMGKDVRSLNLSNAVAVVLYEALRQLGFPGMS